MGRYDDERDYDDDIPADLDIRRPSMRTGAGEYAGFWLRFLAFIVDYLVLLIPSLIIGFVLGFVGAIARLDENAIRVLAYLVGVLISWLYWAGQESSAAQATLGKRAVGLIVTDAQGRRISFGRATGRYFGKIISGAICLIGYMMAGWTERKQALHDLIADTLVVRGTPQG